MSLQTKSVLLTVLVVAGAATANQAQVAVRSARPAPVSKHQTSAVTTAMHWWRTENAFFLEGVWVRPPPQASTIWINTI